MDAFAARDHVVQPQLPSVTSSTFHSRVVEISVPGDDLVSFLGLCIVTTWYLIPTSDSIINA